MKWRVCCLSHSMIIVVTKEECCTIATKSRLVGAIGIVP